MILGVASKLFPFRLSFSFLKTSGCSKFRLRPLFLQALAFFSSLSGCQTSAPFQCLSSSLSLEREKEGERPWKRGWSDFPRRTALICN